jgi:HAMP domain-containing protein
MTSTSPPRNSRLRGWIAKQPIRRKLFSAGAAFVAVIGFLFATGFFAMNALSTVRAYVGGEGLWSKGQKDAVAELAKYAQYEDERYFEQYRAFLRVPLADKRARLELEKESSDLDVADRALIEGRNHADDVRSMSLLFKRFRHISYIDQAIAQWAAADTLIEELELDAAELHRLIQEGKAEGRSTASDRRAVLARIDSVAERLTVVEDQFSFTLGEAARWLRGLLVLVMSLGTAAGLSLGLYVAFIVTNGILSEVAHLREGTVRVAAGDLGRRIPVGSGDELGALAEAFNLMTDELVQSISEQKEAKAELAAHVNALESANGILREHEKVKSEFFSTVSHELRTPLSLIVAPLESLLDGGYGALPAGTRPLLETMHNNAARLLQMMQGLLDFQKSRPGRWRFIGRRSTSTP